MRLDLKLLAIIFLSGLSFTSCDDFLDKEPPSYITPEDYYKSEDEVQACANQFYSILPSHSGWGYGTFGSDDNTDNQADMSADNKFAKGLWRVGNTNGNWAWSNIRNINYQLNAIMGSYKAKKIQGSDTKIRQYIGEIYFFRAYAYFDMLQKWGDLPIVTQSFPDDDSILVAANKRRPCNEVARFIISDLDTAMTYMQEDFEPRHTRVSPKVANLFKSRVALYEGSWLTNFAGTPFVPNGPGWPGKNKDYNADYNYPTGSVEAEAKYFFQVAAQSAEEVAEKYKGSLVTNTGSIPQSTADPDNPYFSLFGNTDMSKYPEVLLWREYSKSLGEENNVEVAIQHGDIAAGLTRGMVESFLMKDGRPIYASNYQYEDTTLASVAKNRDPRLTIFMKVPGQVNVFKNMDATYGDHAVPVEPVPNITNRTSENGYSTGYTIRKGGTFDKALCANGQGYTASITFRATEALLNYMEAEYMLTKDINAGHILEYWKIVRQKAGFTGDAVNPEVTIQATDMSKEKLDWGAYTAGTLLTDKVLYNIRRERRCELMAEGLRWMDLERWRSLDQLISTPYHIEGFHLWNTPMEKWYNNLVANGSSSSNASEESRSEYYRPYEIISTNNSFYDGFTWAMAQYLQPLPIKEFLLTSSDNASIDKSPLYQNPYWPTTPDEPAEK
ncbi:RagB/SusD family nutrient uptake outer membrane protein [Prevotella cerevisiae]|uniref:RagB/SusD family nutrient uptake outer membrane protein n=1 Tax=Segatella cerevisiae TaxID=2053716 RepID=A0ABT1C0S0_9BACT|nr:RagB/SusD family nutrient uptake outer membrane protein [Segatella cerevisiae]MCO6026203.1 RagB/SusD family nutrient uptake outer membrane protein [Segatella cerevisiae]